MLLSFIFLSNLVEILQDWIGKWSFLVVYLKVSWVRRCWSLNLVLLGLRTAVREDVATNSAELGYGEKLPLPSELIFDRRDRILALTTRPFSNWSRFRHFGTRSQRFTNLGTSKFAPTFWRGLTPTRSRYRHHTRTTISELEYHTFDLDVISKSKTIYLNRRKPFFQEANGSGRKGGHHIRFG